MHRVPCHVCSLFQIEEEVLAVPLPAHDVVADEACQYLDDQETLDVGYLGDDLED